MFWMGPGADDFLQGVVMGYFRGKYHLFTTKGKLPERTVHHAVSSDLLSWRDLPDAIGIGKPGSFDGYTLYDLHVFESGNRYYMFYTGLDTDKPGQKQAIGLATSNDLVTWKRHPRNPVLRADPRWYEQAVPDEATYQAKDNRRLWFRDPWVIRDGRSGSFGMAVGARALDTHPDLRGCVAWAESDDLVNWIPRPPIYSPQRFHTVECPVIFEHGGLHYLIFLTHPHWGTPFLTTDPHQRCGGFYAISRSGLRGPYETPSDEVLVGGAFVRQKPDGREMMRSMVVRVVNGPGNAMYAHYHFTITPAQNDDTAGSPYVPMLLKTNQVMPIPKQVAFKPNGEMHLAYNPVMDRFLRPVALRPPALPPDKKWRRDGKGFACKNFTGRSVLLFDHPVENGLIEVGVSILVGLRAGIVLRASGENGPGWIIVLDRRWNCLTFGLLDGQEPVDRRLWRAHTDRTTLRVVFTGPFVEIYCDNALMLHQARWRERGGRIGLVAENAEAIFENINVRALWDNFPLPTTGKGIP